MMREAIRRDALCLEPRSSALGIVIWARSAIGIMSVSRSGCSLCVGY